MEKKTQKIRSFNTTRVIMSGFLLGSILGALLLYLPISHKSGMSVSFIDALFVSVSGICVTGLSPINIGATLSVFGQIVLLLLIQIGGLGVVTFTTLLLIAMKKRLSLTDRMLLQSAYNVETLAHLVKLTFRILKVTLVIEAIGSVGYCLVFIPEFGLKGIWYGVFHSVSAFCNAGFDILGGDSFTAYRDNPIINFTTVVLVILSGLGFPVYWEIIRVFNERKHKNSQKLSTHAKLVLFLTALLVLFGTILTFIFEYNNPETIGNLSFFNKLQASLFQSVTLRTAGFATINQASFTNASSMLYLVFMFIGGSPAGTAGGVKTVTVAVLLASMFCNIRGRKDVILFRRKIADEYVRRCIAIVAYSLSTLIVLTTILLAVQQGELLDILYEMTSAIATVGLSRGMTSEFGVIAKIIICVTMYLGRIGPITLALAFNTHSAANDVSYAETKIIIG